MKKASKRKTILVGVLITLIGLGVGVTIAYYSLIANVVNEFQTATYNINITESFNGTWGNKTVFVQSDDTTNSPVYLRFSYTESWSKKSGDTIGFASNKINSTTDSVTKYWSFDSNNNIFVQESDGWFYLTSVLEPYTRIQILDAIHLCGELDANNASYDPTIASKYAGYDYNLTIHYETIHANPDAAQEIWGKTATVGSGGSVTWS